MDAWQKDSYCVPHLYFSAVYNANKGCVYSLYSFDLNSV